MQFFFGGGGAGGYLHFMFMHILRGGALFRR